MQVAHMGIIGAMPQEIELLLRDIKEVDKRTLGVGVGARTYYHGTLYQKDVTLAFSRWGKVASASTISTLIDVFNVDFVLFTGVAGALSMGLNIGDVVISSDFVHHDLDASAIPGIKRYEDPLMRVSHFSVKPEYVELARRSAERYLNIDLPREIGVDVLTRFGISQPQVVVGLVVSGDQFIADIVLRERIRSGLPKALCVEMEGAAVAQVCYERGIPMVAVRAISDRADQTGAPDFLQFVEAVACHFTAGTVREFIKQI